MLKYLSIFVILNQHYSLVMKIEQQELIFLTSVHKQMIWGGEKLKEIFNDISESKIGESWVVSCLGHDQSLIKNGIYKGLTLEELYCRHREVFGNYPSDIFPLLIKYIDAKTNLSIQVHPDDNYAKLYEHSLGKSECWLVLDCEENTKMIIGHHYKDKENLKEAIVNKTLEKGLNSFRINKNDFFYIPTGTLHAICAGSLIYEIQQNSNITYRMYDYGRCDANGKERELHIQKSLDVCEVPMNKIQKKSLDLNGIECGCDEKYFKVISLRVKEKFEFDCTGYFYVVGCLDGYGEINGFNVKSGDHFIVCNQIKKLYITGDMHLIISEPKA